jgi:hypothetical protein
MNTEYQKYHLTCNPFPPAATGLGGVLKENEHVFLPKSQDDLINEFYQKAVQGQGPKMFNVVGAYGAGKTAVLKGYLKIFFENKDIKVFYFDNPGVQFYDLANILMRDLGRYEFSKAIWERCKQYISEPQPSLFEEKFEDMLSALKKQTDREKMARELCRIIKNDLEYTPDDEIAYKIGMLVVETHIKPYFEYRDFVVSSKKSLVAEKQEERFFQSIIKAILDIYRIKGVAFLIDEFEEIAFSKGMSKIKTYEYLATFRRLIDISENEDLWIAIAMTPEAMQATQAANNALKERFVETGSPIELEPFTKEEIEEWLKWWLNRYRIINTDKMNSLFPFPDNISNILSADASRCTPRKLVKICFYILSEAFNKNLDAPFTSDFVTESVNKIFSRDDKNV